jgi:hypothetical protein
VDKTVRTITGWAAGVAVVLGGAAVAVIATQSPAPAGPGPGTFTATGTFRLEANAYPKTSGACGGLNGFSDVKDGLTVRVTDELNTVDTLATGTLGTGRYVGQGCEWSFTVADVPTGHGVYAVMIGNGTSEEISEDLMRKPLAITDGYLRK